MSKLKSEISSDLKINYFMFFLKAAFIIAMVFSLAAGNN
jgi:hypothetical protein